MAILGNLRTSELLLYPSLDGICSFSYCLKDHESIWKTLEPEATSKLNGFPYRHQISDCFSGTLTFESCPFLALEQEKKVYMLHFTVSNDGGEDRKSFMSTHEVVPGNLTT